MEVWIQDKRSEFRSRVSPGCHNIIIFSVSLGPRESDEYRVAKLEEISTWFPSRYEKI
jgi:hypothetical protein